VPHLQFIRMANPSFSFLLLKQVAGNLFGNDLRSVHE
jgi:hypothetical protein